MEKLIRTELPIFTLDYDLWCKVKGTTEKDIKISLGSTMC